MYKDFDIEVFNKEFEAGDISGLKYIGKTIIDRLPIDLVILDRNDYLKDLYSAVMSLNGALSAVESNYGEYITDKNFFEYYSTIRDLLFEELGLEWNGEKYELNN